MAEYDDLNITTPYVWNEYGGEITPPKVLLTLKSNGVPHLVCWRKGSRGVEIEVGNGKMVETEKMVGLRKREAIFLLMVRKKAVVKHKDGLKLR